MTAHQKTTEFLLAARYGQYDLLQNLLNTNDNCLINSQDKFGTSALHLAVMYGHQDVIKILLAHPKINTNLQAYLNNEFSSKYSPLDMAIKYKLPIESIKMLVEAGASTNHPEVLLEMLFDDRCGVVENENNAVLTVKDYAPFEAALEILDVLIKEVPSMSSAAGIPVSIFLQAIDAALADPQAKMLVQKIMANASEYHLDRYDHAFLIAKDLTHVFPSSNNYLVKNDFFVGEMEAEGHLRPFVANSFYESVVEYQNILKNSFTWTDYAFEISGMPLANYLALKLHVFSELNSTYYLADLSLKHSALYDTSKILYQFYSEGNTILLPTGWEGHGIDIILDKNLGLYAVANTGDRYTADLPGGVHAYQNTSPISDEDIYAILNNSMQHNLEYEHYYKLGLVENLAFSREFPDQVYGNCGINSLLVANWELTYISLFKQTNDPILSKQLAELWHQDLVEHHKTYVLKEYLSEPYFADDQPLYNALINYEDKLDHKEKIEQTKLILDYLSSPEHVIDFRNFYDTNQQEFSVELSDFIHKNGYDSVIHPSDVLFTQDLLNGTELVLQFQNTSISENRDNTTEIYSAEHLVTVLPIHQNISLPFSEPCEGLFA